MVLSGSGALPDVVAAGVLKPLNAKLGQQCFQLGASAGAEVAVNFDKACADPSIAGPAGGEPAGAALRCTAGAAEVGGEEPRHAQEADDLGRPTLRRSGARRLVSGAPGNAGRTHSHSKKNATTSASGSVDEWPKLIRPRLRSMIWSRLMTSSVSPSFVT